MIKNSKKLITIVGGGNIGSSWALVFLLHGYRVSLYDKNYEVQSISKKSIKRGLNLFTESNNLDSKKIKNILSRINFFKDLKEALYDTKYVIEAINENLKDKINVFNFWKTQFLTPSRPSPDDTEYKKRKQRKRFRKRDGIEATISDLKQDFRLGRCFLKGEIGDQINVTLSSAAHNLRKRIRFRLEFFFNLVLQNTQ